MPIQYVSGDIFFNTFSAKAFAHGCNCQGSMGAGIAKTFKERYPEMYDTYRESCKSEPRGSLTLAMFSFGKRKITPGFLTLALKKNIGMLGLVTKLLTKR